MDVFLILFDITKIKPETLCTKFQSFLNANYCMLRVNRMEWTTLVTVNFFVVAFDLKIITFHFKDMFFIYIIYIAFVHVQKKHDYIMLQENSAGILSNIHVYECRNL